MLENITIIPDLPGEYAMTGGDLDRYAMILAPDYNGDGCVMTVLANGSPVVTLTIEAGSDNAAVEASLLLSDQEPDTGYHAQSAAGLLMRIGHVGEDFGTAVAEIGWAATEKLLEEDDCRGAHAQYPELWREDGHEWVAFIDAIGTVACQAIAE